MLRILKTNADGHTGHITVECHIEERQDNSVTKGAVETVGIHPDALHGAYGGDVKLWLQDMHRGMIERHEARKRSAKAMDDLKKIETLDL